MLSFPWTCLVHYRRLAPPPSPLVLRLLARMLRARPPTGKRFATPELSSASYPHASSFFLAPSPLLSVAGDQVARHPHPDAPGQGRPHERRLRRHAVPPPRPRPRRLRRQRRRLHGRRAQALRGRHPPADPVRPAAQHDQRRRGPPPAPGRKYARARRGDAPPAQQPQECAPPAAAPRHRLSRMRQARLRPARPVPAPSNAERAAPLSSSPPHPQRTPTPSASPAPSVTWGSSSRARPTPPWPPKSPPPWPPAWG